MSLPRMPFVIWLAAVAALLMPAAASAAAPTAALPGPIPDGCSSINLNDTDAVEKAAAAVSHVFVGRITGVREVPADGSDEGDAPRPSATDRPQGDATDGRQPTKPVELTWQHEVAVKASLKGSVAAGATVEIVFDDAPAKPRRLAPGETYVFFADGSMSPLHADACEGYVVAGAFDVESLREVVAPSRPDLGSLTPPQADAGDRPELGRLVAPGAAITLIGVLGLLLLGRVGRRR